MILTDHNVLSTVQQIKVWCCVLLGQQVIPEHQQQCKHQQQYQVQYHQQTELRGYHQEAESRTSHQRDSPSAQQVSFICYIL